MADKYSEKCVEYVENARQKGLTIERHFANGLDYLFVYEADGWVSVFDVTGGVYRTVIQAKDKAHAESYIAMIEPLPFQVNRL